MANSKDIPTIIACIDTTEASLTTLRYACHKAKKSGFAVQILSVMEASHKNMLFGAKAITQDKRQTLEKHLKKIINEVYQETDVMPSVSIREGDISTEIIREIKSTPNCAMLIFGKSHNSLSDNIVLPKISRKIGKKIIVPITIVPENLSEDYFKNFFKNLI